jgi:uncharacterized repeat protein (TIGR03803 family)
MTGIAFAASLALSAASLSPLAPPATAATETVIYSFKFDKPGEPVGRLHFMRGSLFGTVTGQPSGYGQVFELTESAGTWTESPLIKFNDTDGAYPAAGLIQEAGGLLFGTTALGDAYAGGNVFELHQAGGSWTHETLWAFGGTSGDGKEPLCDLVADGSGNLYGTTFVGGSASAGTVFELTESGGTWAETVLHSFANGSDGANPEAGLLLKGSALYGTTSAGGAYLEGTIYELTQSSGVWTESVLYDFAGGSDGAQPIGALIKGSKGKFFGTTEYGGGSGCSGGAGCGTVFELSQSGGAWTEKVLYAFTGGGDGAYPAAGLVLSGTGALYGTAQNGGKIGEGVAFKLTKSGGTWSETVLHSFGGKSDGANPEGPLILDKLGNLYGTTSSGGAHDNGAVYEITP